MSEIYIPESSNFASEKAKILSEEKTKAWQGIPKVASALMRDQDPYPSPYLNLSDYQLPKTMGEIFKWCRYFYKFDSLVGAAVNTMSRFPVTDILFDEPPAFDQGPMAKEDSPILSLYKEVFDELHVNDELIRIGIDYWLYGNCFIFGEFDNFSQDPNVPDIRWSRIFRLDPSKMTIDLDPLTQEKTYKWEVPAKIKNIVKARKPLDKFQAIPDIIKKAAKENKPIILNPRNVYHFSREGESGDGSVWGTPLILNVMKQLAYRNLLRQAQEAIAREHIVPLRVYYLNPTERMDPMGNWNNVARSFGAQLEQAARDPNYKVVSPIPVNVLNLGGQGRALMLTGEIDQLQAEILAGMGVPREFIFGGVSYSAASISLRTLENQFITYRNMLVDFLNNFLIKRMAEIRGEWSGPLDKPNLVTIKLADLKMQDDIQQKQMIINMNAGGKVSDEYMYNMLGMDPQKMKVQLELEIFERMDRERRMQMYQAETNFMLQQQSMQMQQALGVQAVQMGLAPAPPDPNAVPADQGGKAAPSYEIEHEQAKDMETHKSKLRMQEDKAKAANDAKAKKDDKDAKKSSDKEKDKKPEKKPEKKADEDWGLAKIAMSPAQNAQLEIVVNGLCKLPEDDRTEIIKKMSDEIRPFVLQKMAAMNPNTMTNSGSRNVKLWQMQQHDPVGHIQQANKVMANAAAEASAFNTENAMMPHSQILPERRQTTV